MTDYNFIKRCKNYNIKKSKGLKYETIVKRSMNKIKKLDKKINKDKLNYEIRYNLIIGIEKTMRRLFNEWNYKDGNFYFYEMLNNYENLLREKEKEKFKLCIHKLKLSLPDHLIFEIGTYF